MLKKPASGVLAMSHPIPWIFWKPLAYTALMACAIISTTACAAIQSHPPYQQGQVIDLSQKSVVPFSELHSALLEADVIYIGETHYTPSHIKAAIQVLEILLHEGRTPILGMEMFSWDGQSGLDRYVKGDTTSIEDFLAESQWNNNWGGKYEDYSPLVDFAKKHKLKLLGLNPPRQFVRKVVQKGLTGIGADPDLKKWNISDPFPDDPEYRRVIYEQIEKCHGGMTPEVYQKIYEASVFRDEGMASAITNTMSSLEGSTPKTFVSYTGAGHIQYGLPIPKRVQRQIGTPVKQVTVYLHALDPTHPEDVEYLLEEGIADFVWLTALGPHGRQPRCSE